MPADSSASPDETGLRFLLRLAGWRKIGWLAVLMILVSATEGLGLLLLVPIVQVVSGSPAPGFDADWFQSITQWPLPSLLSGFVVLICLRALILFLSLASRRAMGLSLTRQLRTMLRSAVMAAEWRWLSTQRSADHAALIVGEAARIGTLADQALNMATGAITLIVLLAAALYIAWPLTLMTAALGLLAVFLISLLHARRRHDGDAYSQTYGVLQSHVTNGLVHLRAARISGAQESLARDFERTAAQLQEVEMRYYRSSDGAYVLLQVIAAIMLALLAWLALDLLEMPLALLIPVLAIFARIVPVAGYMQQGYRSWQFCKPALDRARKLIAEARNNAEPAAPDRAAQPLSDRLEIDNISIQFAGRDMPVLRRFSRTITAGSVVGIAGPSGSGKSTLADILSGLIAPDEGEIRIDGVALDPESRILWRQQVAYVEQHPYLFDGTIAQNVAWGRDGATREEICTALKAGSASFVLDLPQGIDTLVGESGRQLSGGERQRISLARALLRKPSLLILDEVTAALDSVNESAIVQSLERLRGSCTCLILGHRAALLDIADEIIDLGAGGVTDDR